MKTYSVDPGAPDPRAIEEAAAVIRGGGLVAFPTETVYGLGANALDPSAVARIYGAKGRPQYNPLIAHCTDADAARRLTRAWPASADRLAAAFWPGPLTLVLPKSEQVPDPLTAGLPTVAIRVPSHPVAQALLRSAGVPIAAPSANRSMEVSPTRAEHVLKGLAGRVDVVLDSGETPLGIESTVIDLSGDQPLLLRPGTLDSDTLQEAIGLPFAPTSDHAATEARPAPGMLSRHYAPRAKLELLAAAESEELLKRASVASASGRTIGAMVITEPPPGTASKIDRMVRMPVDPAGYAQALYATLHLLDDCGCDLVLVEEVPTGSRWAGVRDRLQRAAEPA